MDVRNLGVSFGFSVIMPPAGETRRFTLPAAGKGHVLSLKPRPGAYRSELVRDKQTMLIVRLWPIPMQLIVEMGNGSMGTQANFELTKLLLLK